MHVRKRLLTLRLMERLQNDLAYAKRLNLEIFGFGGTK